jgi:hypothetical protein
MTAFTRVFRMAQSPFQIQYKNLQTVMKRLSIVFNSRRHRVDRVLGFFSCPPNWDPPTHSSPGECVPPSLWFQGGHTRLREKGGSQFGRGDRHCMWYSRYEYTDKKENQIFLIYKLIQSGAVKVIYEEGLPNI